MNIKNQKKLLEKQNERINNLDKLIDTIEKKLHTINKSLENIDKEFNIYSEQKKTLRENIKRLSDINLLADDINSRKDRLYNELDDLHDMTKRLRKDLIIEKSEELEGILDVIPKSIEERFNRTIGEMRKMSDELKEIQVKENESDERCSSCDELGNNAFIQLHVIGCTKEDIEDWNNREISTSRLIKDCAAEPYLYINQEKQKIKLNLLNDDGVIDENNCDMIASYDIRDKSFMDNNDYYMTIWIGNVESNGIDEFDMESCSELPKHNEKILDDIVLLSNVESEISEIEK